MMCDARMWRAQLQSLPMPCVVPVLTETDSVVDAAAAVLNQAPPTFALAGLSMGGIIAFEVLRRAPERVTHLALLDTNPFADSAERQSMRVAQMAQVMGGGLRQLAVDSLKPQYLAEANRDDEELLEDILAMAMDLGPEVFRRQSLLLKNRPDSVATLALIDCPTLIICGAEDALCPVDFHKLMAERIAGAELAIIENCGHLASMEQPAIVSRLLNDFFTCNTTSGHCNAH